MLTAIQKLSIANDIPSIAADSGSLRTFTFANAALGGSVIISPASALPDGVIIAYARVSVAGTVEVKFRNVTTAAIDPPNINYNITIIQ